MASVAVVVPLLLLAVASAVGLLYATSKLDRVVATSTEASIPIAELEAEVRGAGVLAYAGVGSAQITARFEAEAAMISEAFAELAGSSALGESAGKVDAAAADWEEAREVAVDHLASYSDPASITEAAYVGLIPYSQLTESSARRLGSAASALGDELDAARSNADGVRRLWMIVVLVGCAVALAVVAFVLGGLARRIARPIEDLSAATDRLSEGHLGHRVPVDGDDELGQLASSFNTMADAIERGQLDLAHQASHDSLTGLGNRNLLLDHLERPNLAMSDAPGRRALLLADLDDFKKVNDVAGHLAGDRVLVEAARRMRGCLRRLDVAVRLGGDEFAIVLNDITDMTRATEVAERVLVALREPFDVEGTAVELSASIGVTEVVPGASLSELLRNVDLAMYEAKGLGKDAHVTFREEMHNNMSERVRMERDLKLAIDRGELVAHYQPIVDTRSGAIRGAEALVRWAHPERGLVAPGEFISVAEESGLVVGLGWWVLHRASNDLAQWRRLDPQGAPRYVSVNMSAQALASYDSVEQLESVVAGAGILPTDVVLEVTESEMLRNGQTTRGVLTALRRLGFRIAIDDFGTGYSSLSYLTQYPVDILKIDKTFVDALGTGSEEHALAAAIVAIGQALHIDTIAEGIEDPDQASILSDLGCHMAQGFHYSRPVPADDLAALIRQRSAVPTT